MPVNFQQKGFRLVRLLEKTLDMDLQMQKGKKQHPLPTCEAVPRSSPQSTCLGFDDVHTAQGQTRQRPRPPDPARSTRSQIPESDLWQDLSSPPHQT
mmetsp:Transcript_76851/g.156321  ORF Transcript_76851/g.156321 Transcript_76851/m.156321 type:complete len:97 (-) Transcript_76851:617-907(-)